MKHYGFGTMTVNDPDEGDDDEKGREDKGNKCGPGVLELYKVLPNGNIVFKLDSLPLQEHICYH